MVRVLILLLALLVAACSASNSAPQLESTSISATSNMDAGAITEAYGAHRNVPLVQGRGVVVRVLKDDTRGLQHQKFLLKVSDNITILIAHNIDVAPRVEPLAVGDIVAFKGEYIYTPKGGTVHWTHRDPSGHHNAGWLKHDGKIFD